MQLHPSINGRNQNCTHHILDEAPPLDGVVVVDETEALLLFFNLPAMKKISVRFQTKGTVMYFFVFK